MAEKKILVLGCGMVARPCVEYLVRDPKNEVTVDPRAPLDYLARAIDEAAKAAGITVLNEVGVNPGVDHLYAIKKIDEVHAQNGKILEFCSYCGGLPAPECSDNPLKFKFSWSPRGALLSQYNSAVFIKDNKVVEIPAEELMSKAVPYYVLDGYDFVAYPNRNSVPFREYYNIPEAHTVIRGSLRYKGNPSFVNALIRLGWLDMTPKSWLVDGITWAEVWQKLITSENTEQSSIIARIKDICNFPNQTESDRIISGLQWMGILAADKASVIGANLLDTLCARLQELMSFQNSERDLVMLQHKFVVEWANGQQETFTSTLELLGDPQGYSGMSKSVGVTCGIATQLLLDKNPAVTAIGVLCPYKKEMRKTIRELVEREGINMVDAKV